MTYPSPLHGRPSATFAPSTLLDPEILNPIRKIGLIAAVCLAFLRYSLLHEFLAFYASVKYLLYVFTIPAVIGVLSSRGIQRTFSSTPARLWLAFTIWMFLGVPFSTWQGESAQVSLNFLRTNLPMLFILGGLILTWRDCRLVVYTIALAGIWIVMIQRIIGSDYGYRTGLEFGVISNPNDYAAHLLLILPFLIFLVIHPPKVPILGMVLRPLGVAVAGYALYSILMSGSRGALVALGAGALYALTKASASTRVVLVFLFPVVGLALMLLLPGQVVERLKNFSNASVRPNSGDDIASDVQTSTQIREMLLRQSLEVSFRRPIFGVGPGEFANYTGRVASEEGRRGGWGSTHNSFTQISSECGLPALLFYVGAIFATYRMIQKTRRQIQLLPDLKQRPSAQLCSAMLFFISLSLINYCVAIFFLNFAYFFYLPAFTGLAIALTAVAHREFLTSPVVVSKLAPKPATAPAAWTPAPAVPALGNPIRFGRYRR